MTAIALRVLVVVLVGLLVGLAFRLFA